MSGCTVQVSVPTKLWAAAEMAKRDFMLVRRRKNYTIYMGGWHMSRFEGNKCAVCFAGSVMACTLKTPSDQSRWFNQFDDNSTSEGSVGRGPWGRVFRGLNQFRQGHINYAANQMGVDYSRVPFAEMEKLRLSYVSYEQNAEKFLRWVGRAVKVLKKYDL